ncbi:hypothetical protein AXG93_2381s1210 [Marchantia polymorpha subsp. ruderalis]|uniref:Uncharacterized protein n=1 Tax=Marchantia polymorpha subsp. ruderalis TaxID=1480154 RepID=A0A176VR27_MARPO|nr:hypothetical protein AXG93_2381s1210 [Marchantia polymorpha subsp. ruderalis]
MHPKNKIDVAADGVSSFCRTKMASKQVGGTGYNILPLDGRSDYLLWEKQVKGKLRSMGLANVLKDKPMHITNIDWKDSKEQAVYIVMGYLDTSVMKQVEEYPEVTQLFDALQRRFHQKRGGTEDVVILSPIQFKYCTYCDPGLVAIIGSGQFAACRVQAAEI